MPEQTKPSDGGLGAPAKRGRPRKDGGTPGVANGVQQSAGGNAEPLSGIEGTDSRPEPVNVRPNGFVPIDPLNISEPTGSDDNGDQPRRGRKRGGKNRPKPQEETVSNLSALLKIERLLSTGCFFMANLLESPELNISESESAEIADALKELSKHYPIGMSEKTIAWVNFSFAVGGVFGPKVVAIYKRPAKPRPRLEPTPIRNDSTAAQAPPAAGPVLDVMPEAAPAPVAGLVDLGGGISPEAAAEVLDTE